MNELVISNKFVIGPDLRDRLDVCCFCSNANAISRAPRLKSTLEGQSNMASDSEMGQSAPAPRIAYIGTLIAELRLLVRAISNDPNKTLTSLRMAYQTTSSGAPEILTSDRVLKLVSEIEDDPKKQMQLESIAFLQSVRDALVAMTRPVTGLSLAYTTLVAGAQRKSDAESSFQLAAQAYGLLERRAKWHRRFVWVLLALGVTFTVLAAWEATKAALGKSLLQNMDVLRAQQATIMTEKLKLETNLDKPASDSDLLVASDERKLIPSSWLPLCDRYRNRLMIIKINHIEWPLQDNADSPRLASSPAERELCGRDIVLARNIAIVHQEMLFFLQSWTGMVGEPFTGIGKFLPSTRQFDTFCEYSLETTELRNISTTKPLADNPRMQSVCDLEFVIAPILQVTTNYTMPMLFGTIGSLLFVLVDHFTKLRTNTLAPNDLSLMPLRLILGVVIAACVCLLITSYAAPSVSPPGSGGTLTAAGTLVASLTLSASGLAFLAGFGAEAVFNLLQNLIERVFVAEKA
jgi:hypothetical protein